MDGRDEPGHDEFGARNVSSPDLHGHARFRGADADRARRRRARHRGGLYARGQAGRTARARSGADAGRARGARARLAGADAGDAQKRRGGCRVPRPQRRCGGGGRLWPDPARKPILDAPRLGCFNVHASLLAALARRRADQPRHHGRRCRERRHHHENGRGPRHRADGGGRTLGHRARYDGGRFAR